MISKVPESPTALALKEIIQFSCSVASSTHYIFEHDLKYSFSVHFPSAGITDMYHCAEPFEKVIVRE